MADPEMCSTSTPTDGLYRRLRPYLTDDTLQRLHSNMNHAGRGRPLKLPQIEPTNRLFLQLGLLRQDHNTTWEDISTFAGKVLAVQFGEGLPHVSSILHRIQKEIAVLPPDTLPEFLGAVRDFTFVKGAYCKMLNITVGMLQNESSSTSTDASVENIPNGLVIDLEHFRVHCKYPQATVHNWLLKIDPELARLQYTVKQLRIKVDTLMKEYTKKRKNGGSCLSSFLDQSFVDYAQPTSRKRKGDDPSQLEVPVSAPSPLPNVTQTSQSPKCPHCPLLAPKLDMMVEENKELHCKIRRFREIAEKSEQHTTYVSALKEQCTSQESEIKRLKEVVVAGDCSLRALQNEKTIIVQKLAEKSKLCSALARNSNNVHRKAERVARLQEQIRVLERGNREKQEKMDSAQRNCTSLHSSLTKARQREAGLREKIQSLQSDVDKLTAEERPGHQPVLLKTPEGHYTPEVQACVVELMGQEVAAYRVGRVIACVFWHLFQIRVEPHELPSKTTALRFADIGHALSKMQLLEEMKKQLFDLHMDGTTRGSQKIVGHQITLKNGKQMSMGFSAVDRETADSLIDMTMNLMQEIASLGVTTEDETDTVVKELFRHMVSTMTDRAATMKCVGRKLSELKEEMLQDDAGLESLFCNAHVLLGLSTATQKALSAFELRQQWKRNLGRDLLSAFSRFKNSKEEPAAFRLIRMACDVLGPRGDEKNGCRDDWLGYLSLPDVRRSSAIGSYRGNRFNNLFESAAAVLYHRDDIITFFTEYKGSETTLNLKQRSVLEDVKSENIMVMVCALAIVYVSLTGPYWMLVNSRVHYLDMHKYVQTMNTNLEKVRDDDAAVQNMVNTLPSTLETFSLEKNAVLLFVQVACRDLYNRDQLTDLLQTLAVEYLAVIQRQLNDFLPDGAYGQAPSDEQRERMAHCKLTNLFGEASFGDLDYSQNKRRFASLHHHSSITMEKRNQTASWLTSKEPEQQKQLLQRAQRSGKAIRKNHKEREEEERGKARQRLQEKKDEFVQKKNDNLARRFKLIQTIQLAGGPWLTGEEGRQHLATLRTARAKREALKLQVQFHRILLNAKDRLLVMAGKTLNQWADAVCQYIDTLVLADFPVADLLRHRGQTLTGVFDECDSPPTSPRPLSPGPLHHTEDHQQPTAANGDNHHQPTAANDDNHHQPTAANDDNHHQPTAANGDNHHQPTAANGDNHHQPTAADADSSGSRQFANQGEKVAVYYDDTFYVGEVLEVKNKTTATVTFMKRFGTKNAFSWPDSMDMDTIDSKFVFTWNVDMFTTNLRIWCVTDFHSLVSDYATFKACAQKAVPETT